MQTRHTDRLKYFNEQVFTTKNHVIPFVGADFIPGQGMSVLEVGCGERGNLVPFLEAGCRVTGVDLSDKKIANARMFLKAYRDSGQLNLTAMDIYHAMINWEARLT